MSFKKILLSFLTVILFSNPVLVNQTFASLTVTSPFAEQPTSAPAVTYYRSIASQNPTFSGSKTEQEALKAASKKIVRKMQRELDKEGFTTPGKHKLSIDGADYTFTRAAKPVTSQTTLVTDTYRFSIKGTEYVVEKTLLRIRAPKLTSMHLFQPDDCVTSYHGSMPSLTLPASINFPQELALITSGEHLHPKYRTWTGFELFLPDVKTAPTGGFPTFIVPADSNPIGLWHTNHLSKVLTDAGFAVAFIDSRSSLNNKHRGSSGITSNQMQESFTRNIFEILQLPHILGTHPYINGDLIIQYGPSFAGTLMGFCARTDIQKAFSLNAKGEKVGGRVVGRILRDPAQLMQPNDAQILSGLLDTVPTVLQISKKDVYNVAARNIDYAVRLRDLLKYKNPIIVRSYNTGHGGERFARINKTDPLSKRYNTAGPRPGAANFSLMNMVLHFDLKTVSAKIAKILSGSDVSAKETLREQIHSETIDFNFWTSFYHDLDASVTMLGDAPYLGDKSRKVHEEIAVSKKIMAAKTEEELQKIGKPAQKLMGTSISPTVPFILGVYQFLQGKVQVSDLSSTKPGKTLDQCRIVQGAAVEGHGGTSAEEDAELEKSEKDTVSSAVSFVKKAVLRDLISSLKNASGNKAARDRALATAAEQRTTAIDTTFRSEIQAEIDKTSGQDFTAVLVKLEKALKDVSLLECQLSKFTKRT